MKRVEAKKNPGLLCTAVFEADDSMVLKGFGEALPHVVREKNSSAMLNYRNARRRNRVEKAWSILPMPSPCCLTQDWSRGLCWAIAVFAFMWSMTNEM